MLVAPSLGAQDRWENRDRDTSLDHRRRDDDRRLFTWRGTVDDDARIYIRAARIESRTISGRAISRERVNRDHPLPKRDGTLRIQLVDGRGRVHVLQQPNARNDYTAIVRVKDAGYGADSYRFAAYFDPTDDWRQGRGSVWGDVGGDVDLGDRVFRWRGQVDGDLRIVVRPEGVGYSVVSGAQPRDVVASGTHRMQRRAGQLAVSQYQGRGSVSIVQQPSARNNYTAIVRVMDRLSGYGYYDFDLFWQ
jgi:hypothetical protein